MPPRPLSQPGAPTAVLVLEPPRQSGVEGRDLVALATDAARRAWELASGDGDGGLGLTRDEDLARRAAGLLGTTGLADLAHRAGVSARVLTNWAVAWREGGAGGLAVAVGEPFEVDSTALAEGLEVLDGVAEGNRITAERVQLRLGADGLWYRFTKQFNDWTLSGPGAADPAESAGP
jgi:transposase